jgi:hypothetical protein
VKALPKRFDRRLKALEAKVAKLGLNKSRMPLAIAKAMRDADADLWDLERNEPKAGDEDYQLLMDTYEGRCQRLRKIIADGVDAIVRIEGRYYTMDEVFRDDGRLLTLMAIRRRIRRKGGKPLSREEDLEHAVLGARRLVYEHSPKYLAEREARERAATELEKEIGEMELG